MYIKEGTFKVTKTDLFLHRFSLMSIFLIAKESL